MTTESRIDKGDSVPFDVKQGMFSIPSTTESHAELAAAANPNQFLDVAGFILRHGLMGKSTLKFDGNPMQYVEFMRHFNSCYLSKISDADILLSSLFEMLEGKALQAVRGYRHIPSAEALPKVLETLKSRFGNPHRVQEAHRDKLMSTKKLRDDLDSLTEFLSDLNNYKVASDFLSITDRVSPNFIAAVIDRLPLRLRDLFLNQLARRNLLNCKECWVNELINFIENRIGILDSDLVKNRTRNFERLDKPSKPQSKVCFVSSRSKNVNVISSDCDSKVATDRNELKNVSKNVKTQFERVFLLL